MGTDSPAFWSYFLSSWAVIVVVTFVVKLQAAKGLLGPLQPFMRTYFTLGQVGAFYITINSKFIRGVSCYSLEKQVKS